LPINNDANVEWISILVSSVGVVVDQDVAVTSAELTLEWRLPPDTSDNLVFIKLEIMEPDLLFKARNDSSKITSKIANFGVSLATCIIDDVADLPWFQHVGGVVRESRI
jgi:hypothetical protein